MRCDDEGVTNTLRLQYVTALSMPLQRLSFLNSGAELLG